MAEHIGIELEVIGLQEYKQKLQEAQRYTKSLSGKKLKIDLSANSQSLKRQLQEVRNQLGEYKKEIKVLQGYKDLNFEVKIRNAEEIANVRQRIRELKAELKELQLSQDYEGRSDAIAGKKSSILERQKQLNQLLAEKNRIDEELDDIDIKIKKVDVNRKDLEAAKEEINNLLRIEPAINYKAVFKAGKSIQGAIGTSLETIGNGLTSISHNVITETVTGIFRQLGYGLTNLATEGLQGSIARYDILKTFPQTMEAIGFSSEDSQRSIERLNESVLGLPTSLSEIVDVAKRYTTALGDIDRGTDLAIAANNAFLASASEDSQKYQGMLQIADLVAGKQLNAREWNSLNASMATAMKYVGEQLGYTSHQEFLQALTSNKISNKEFLDALIESGTEGKIAELTQIAKSKLGSAVANIKNAFARGGANVLEGLDEALKLATGKDIVENVADITKVIDDSAGKIVKWMKENPQVIKEWVDRLKSIDIVGFLEGTARGLKDTFALFTALLKMLPGGMSGAGHFFVMAGAYGRIVTTIGQFVKGFSPVGGVINVFAKWKKSGQPVFEGMGNFFKSAKRVSKAEGVADAATTATNIEKAGKSAFNIVDALKKVASAVGIFVVVGAGITAVIGEILLVGMELKKLGKIGKQIDWYEATDTLTMIGVLMGLIGGLAMAIKPISAQLLVATTMLGLITTVISGFAALDTWLIKKSAENINAIVRNFRETADLIKAVHWGSGDTYKIKALVEAMGEILNDAFWNGFGLINGLVNLDVAQNLNDIFDALKDTVTSMGKISGLVTDLNVPDQSSLDKLNQMATWIGEFYNLFDDDTFDLSILDTGEVGTQESGNLNKILSSFQGAVDSIKGIVDTMNAMEESLNSLLGDENAGRMATIRHGVSAVVYNLKEMLVEFNEIYKDLNESLGGNTAGYRALFSSAFTGDNGNGKTLSETANSVLSNFTGMLSAIESIVDLLDTLASKTDLLTNKDSGGRLGYAINGIKTVIDKFKEIVIYFNDMEKELNEALGGNTAGLKSIWNAGWSGDPGNGGRALSTMGTFMEGFMSTIETIGEIMNKLSTMQGSFVNLEEVGGVNGIVSRIQSLMRNLMEMVKSFDEYSGVDVDTFGSTIESLSKAIETINGSMTTLVAMSTSITSIGVTDGQFNIAKQIGDLITQLGMSLGKLDEQGLSEKAFAFSLAINAMMSSVQSLIGTDATGLAGITAELGNIGTALDELSNQFEQFFSEQDKKFSSKGAEWKQALINGLNFPELSGIVNASLNAILSSRDFYSNGYSTGASYSNGIAAGMRSRVAGSSAVRGVMAALGRYATGGEVQYRAGGGSLFKPRGTDTVPAMLTPGEWVMRKRAVDTLGKGFMDRINNLDIPGALYALSTKAGARLASINPKIINNTTNNTNNARLTQNIYSNNQNFAFRRADRYVRAL